MNNYKLLYENEHFIFYLTGDYLTGDYLNNVHLDSKSKEIQEYYDSEEVMSHESKLKKLDELIKYFYNYWKLVEKIEQEKKDKNIETVMYIMNFNINLVMFNVPISYFLKFKQTLNSLNTVIIKYWKESYIRIESKFAKYFLDLILTFYTPIKPIHIID